MTLFPPQAPHFSCRIFRPFAAMLICSVLITHSSIAQEPLQIDSLGNVGIGAFPRLATRLVVGGKAEFLDTVLASLITPRDQTLRIKANVGINHSIPAYKLTIGGTGDIFGVDNGAIFWAKNLAGNYEPYFWPRLNDNVMYMNYGSAGLNIRNNSSVSALFINNDRQVGIGTTSPTSALTVKGYGASGTIRVLPVADNGEAGVGFYEKANGSGLPWVISQGGWGRTGKLVFGQSDPKMVIQQDGKVGIGTTNPTSALSVQGEGALGTIRIMPSENNKETGVGFYQYQDAATVPWIISQGGWQNTGKLVFGYTNPKMTIQQDGSVGIGTTTPGAPLEVKSFKWQDVNKDFHLVDVNGRDVFRNYKDPNNVSIIASGSVVARSFYAVSDLRVKKSLAISDPGDDLHIIKQLEVTRYQYKDPIQNGSGYATGFVAQQVEQIFPQAVNKRPDFIPDIFMLADTTALTQGNLVVTMKKPHLLVTGNQVRLITAAGETREEVVTVTGEKTFIVSRWNKPAEKVFVYGRKADDVRAVDYQQLFSLGIGATQELARQTDELKAENQQLKTSLDKLALQLQALEEKVNRLAAKE